ncbi:MAG: YceI family protein [Brumimicrobium sp.]
MVTITAIFTLFAGVLATIAHSRNNYGSVKSISYYILGLSVLILSFDYFQYKAESNQLIPLFLISILSVHFFLGEVSKNKTALLWNIIPVVLSFVVLLLPNLAEYSYMDFSIGSNNEVLIIAIVSSLTPFLTHLAKLGIGSLIITFGSIKWAENEENYLESLVSYAFIGGVAALGMFLMGNLGLLVAGTFYLSASFIARNKLGLENDIISAASGAMFLIVLVPILLSKGGFETLDFTRGEVLEGAFVAGFMIIFYDLLLRLARHNIGTWKFLLTFKSLFVPILAILLLGFAYTQLERLGGVLALAGIIMSMAILSITFALFKNTTYVALKLTTIGVVFLILPYVSPVESKSSIDLNALGIETNDNDKNSKKSEKQKEKAPKGKDLSEGIGKWLIDSENSKVSFELGPDNGRTKGEFQVVKGDFNVKENVNNSEISVTLPVESLTTFNSMRDEHLMESEYFHEEKYPKITFKSTQFEKSNDAYEVKGDFTMMNVTKSIEVTLKLVGIGEKDGKKTMVLWGTSQIDRTEFGMSSSSKIGDVVDFNFEVQLSER